MKTAPSTGRILGAEHELPTATVVCSSQAPPASRRGQLRAGVVRADTCMESGWLNRIGTCGALESETLAPLRRNRWRNSSDSADKLSTALPHPTRIPPASHAEKNVFDDRDLGAPSRLNAVRDCSIVVKDQRSRQRRLTARMGTVAPRTTQPPGAVSSRPNAIPGRTHHPLRRLRPRRQSDKELDAPRA